MTYLYIQTQIQRHNLVTLLVIQLWSTAKFQSGYSYLANLDLLDKTSPHTTKGRKQSIG
ncbi:hypothetical protein PM082_016554 [Marasmius tenuissimus]|nr:hypothetical protein PM082_016554 [Marasmius tenuissimus]